jgi:DNA-binding NarL/FixJ family response regulator
MHNVIPNVLLIDANSSHADIFNSAHSVLGSQAFHLECCGTLCAGLDRLRRKGILAVFVNLFLPDSHGLETFRRLITVAPQLPIVVLGERNDVALVGEALRQGAQNYLFEGHIDTYSFARAVRNVIARKAAEEAFRLPMFSYRL